MFDANNKIILGIKINDQSAIEILAQIEKFRSNNSFSLIFTPNPEICLLASQDSIYRDTVNNADLRIPDGFGLKIGARILNQKLEHRLTGADLTAQILTKYSSSKIFIINRADGLSSLNLIKESLQKKFPQLQIAGIEVLKNNFDLKIIAEQINNYEPDLVFCTLGAPIQEKLLCDLKSQYEIKAQIGLAVGGSFDFFTSKQIRAPKIFRALGLEWLFRLIKQPRRINRIFSAVIKFPLACLQWKKRMRNEYRPNVMGIIKKNDLYLIQNNPRFGGEHWQFPQGGIDHGEKPEQAVIREVAEEVGINENDLRIIKKIPIDYKYTYQDWHNLLNGYKGQEQQFFLLEYLGDKMEFPGSYEVSQTKWVAKTELEKYIFPKRLESLYKILPFI